MNLLVIGFFRWMSIIQVTGTRQKKNGEYEEIEQDFSGCQRKPGIAAFYGLKGHKVGKIREV